MKRASGILLHITSLPSDYGVGNLGREARKFVDFLAQARQSYWQILPIGPTGFGDSPYQAVSSFAGNPYLLDLEPLLEQELLTTDEVSQDWGADPSQTDFGLMYEKRLPLLRRAFERAMLGPDFEKFCRDEAPWLEDYSLFMAIKASFGGKSWVQWDENIRLREPRAMERCRRELAGEIRFHKWLQYLFYHQWEGLRDYAHEKGISIIGDIPIYVPLDSADVWSSPGCFLLDQQGQPRAVAGCPPDAFNEDGQYWGNPIYNWPAMAKDGYRWWLRRIGAAARFFDVIRIDHFRGLESYWSIPAGAKTAATGQWVKGPGMDLVGAIRQAFPETSFIAEDLGFQSEEVRQLLADSGFPGMKVLEFAFDSREPSDYLPHTYPTNCVCYTGTHDNETLRQWYEEASSDALDRDYARRYMKLGEGEDFCEGVLRLGMASRADLFVCQMQDYLCLGAQSRMNEPGTLKTQNWRWRMLPGAADRALADRLAAMTIRWGRA